MPISEKQLAEVINIITQSDASEKEKEAPATKEELRAEILAELRAEAEAKKKEAENKADKEEEAKDKEESSVNAQRENKYISKSLASSLEKSGVSSDVVDSLSGFIAYDTLKNEQGEADEEKISEFAGLIGNISNRRPPKAAPRVDVFDDGGLAKYLPTK